MAVQQNNSGTVPTSSGRNRLATGRTLLVAGVAFAVLLALLFVPW